MTESRELTTDERRMVVQDAQDAFWAVVAEKIFPHIKTGDFPPDVSAMFDHQLTEAVRYWVYLNEQVNEPADTGMVYAEILRLLAASDRLRLQDDVEHVYPGYIDIEISDRIIFGFDFDNDTAWRCFVKQRPDETGQPLTVFDVPVTDMTDATAIAQTIIDICFGKES